MGMTLTIKNIANQKLFFDPTLVKTKLKWWQDRRWELLEMARENTPVLVINEESVNQRAFNLLNISNVSTVYFDIGINCNTALLNRFTDLNLMPYCKIESFTTFDKTTKLKFDNDNILLDVGKDIKNTNLSPHFKYVIPYEKHAGLDELSGMELVFSAMLDLSEKRIYQKQLDNLRLFLNSYTKTDSVDTNILLEIICTEENESWIETFEDLLYDLLYDFPKLKISLLCSDYLLGDTAVVLTQIKSPGKSRKGKLDLSDENSLNILADRMFFNLTANDKTSETTSLENIFQAAKSGDILLVESCGSLERELSSSGIASRYLKSRRVCTVCNL